MKELIKKIMPPGYEKQNRRKLYNVIGRLGDLSAADSVKVLRDFFPYLADEETLKEHAEALSIPRYASDTDEAFRRRVATAAFYIFRKGTRDFFRSAMAQRFPGRNYEFIEDFLHLQIRMQDMTEEDRAWINEFFNAELDPNILLGFIHEYLWEEAFGEASDDLEYSATLGNESEDEWKGGGFRYNGAALFDHGRVMNYDGEETYSGNRKYWVYPVLGTWTDKAPEEISTQPALYVSDEDVLDLTISIAGITSEEEF